MPKHRDHPIDWQEAASPAERALYRQAIGYECRYFTDMTLEAPRIKRKLLRHEILNGGEWRQTETDPPLVTIENGWSFRYQEFPEDESGLCDTEERKIEICRGLAGDSLKRTLLHEMIHAYLYMIPGALREWLLLDLYERMKRHMPNRKLQRFINSNAHMIMWENNHGTLFLLKSLELDRRCKWNCGTVFAYGREEWK